MLWTYWAQGVGWPQAGCTCAALAVVATPVRASAVSSATAESFLIVRMGHLLFSCGWFSHRSGMHFVVPPVELSRLGRVDARIPHKSVHRRQSRCHCGGGGLGGRWTTRSCSGSSRAASRRLDHRAWKTTGRTSSGSPTARTPDASGHGRSNAASTQLRQRIRTESGKAPNAVAVIIDSQSVKAAETVSAATRSYHAAKKINGRKRYVVVDNNGLPLFVLVTRADLQDRDAVKEVLFRLRLTHPEVTIVWADSAYAGQLVDWAKQHLDLTLKTVSRPKGAKGFVVVPRRWGVERSLSWLTRARRNVRDYGTPAAALRSPPDLGSRGLCPRPIHPTGNASRSALPFRTRPAPTQQ